MQLQFLQVCGMAWSPETNTHFLATGANDNLVHIWDDRNVSAPIHTFSDHQAAIKAWITLSSGFLTLTKNCETWNKFLIAASFLGSLKGQSELRGKY